MLLFSSAVLRCFSLGTEKLHSFARKRPKTEKFWLKLLSAVAIKPQFVSGQLVSFWTAICVDEAECSAEVFSSLFGIRFWSRHPFN